MTEINKVKRALSQGFRTREAIAAEVGLTQAATQTYLTRLIGRDQAESTRSPDPIERSKNVKHYHMSGVEFLLQDIWRVR